jgi:hypothetical protein
MKQIKPNLLYISLLFLSTFFLITINHEAIATRLSEAEIAQIELVPAPSLQNDPLIENVSSNNPTLPPEVQSAVFEDTVGRTSKTVDALRVVEAEPQNWTDGCLGLSKPEEICTQAIVPGWRVVVSDGIREWAYRTDDSGSLVKLEESP